MEVRTDAQEIQVSNSEGVLLTLWVERDSKWELQLQGAKADHILVLPLSAIVTEE